MPLIDLLQCGLCGFMTGDTYIYPWANTKAEMTETDDDYYFVHRGKLDLFNFSRKPGGNNDKILENFKRAYKFRQDNIDLITKGNFTQLMLFCQLSAGRSLC